ncbi:integrase catalytic domain-containing protein [Trichonephila clavipes]|nr:integrase catalytic domain-containing protein [Trichonephila clavipes]
MVGGWWERLVRIIKELLRRSLGKSILSYEELSTVICDCEFLINSRPLTYISENPQELIPLTPAMFLIENRCSDTTDIDELNSRDLRKRMKYRIKLLSDLRQRFRKEYLRNNNKKRLSWPIAKIIELIPGRDWEIRTVRLKTQHGTLIRPVQRIFPLEVQAIANSDKELKEKSISVKSTKPEKVLNTNDAIVKKYTSSGRLVKEPKRLDLLNYNSNRTRPDISLIRSYLSQFNHNPQKRHYNLAKQVLRYLMGSKDKKLFYGNEFDILNASSNASWENAENGKSFSGGVVLLDSQAAIQWIKGTRSSNKSRHMNLPLHFIKDLIEDTVIKLEYIQTEFLIAAFLTKAMNVEKLEYSMQKISLLS